MLTGRAIKLGRESQTKRPLQRLTPEVFRSTRAMIWGLSMGETESGLVKFRGPTLLGSGQMGSSFSATGSSRFPGMRLPGKGAPVEGSVIGVAKIPFLSSDVGTTPVRGFVSRIDRCWWEKKNQARSVPLNSPGSKMGPPKGGAHLIPLELLLFLLEEVPGVQVVVSVKPVEAAVVGVGPGLGHRHDLRPGANPVLGRVESALDVELLERVGAGLERGSTVAVGKEGPVDVEQVVPASHAHDLHAPAPAAAGAGGSGRQVPPVGRCRGRPPGASPVSPGR